MPNTASLTDKQLEAFIQNHRDKNATDRPVFAEALAERARRKGQGLDFEKTLAAVRLAAREKRFLSYKELADVSGANWTKVHWAMNTHLGELLEYCHRMSLPLLSAIVVNKKNVDAGDIEEEALRGFVTAARALGYHITDERGFFREQQRKAFEWAAGEGCGGDDERES